MSLISIQKTPDYSSKAMELAVKTHFEALGVAADLKKDTKVLIKPNLVSPRKPDTATTTHPEFVFAVVKWLHAHGVRNITIADSPGGLYTPQTLKNTYTVCGYNGIGAFAALNYDTSWQTVHCDESFRNKTFNIITPILEADYIINMPKLKTHGMMTLSGAVKNMFGSVPGIQKPEMHYRWPEINDFADMLIELTMHLKPNITLVDAVESMEGNGPNSGSKKYAGVTFASRDPFTLDKVMADFMKLGSIPMLQEYERMGLIKTPEYIGDAVEGTGFKLPDTASLDFTDKVPKFLRGPAKRFMEKALHPVPKVSRRKCIGCGKCAESCPPHIIIIKNRKAKFTSKGCISCFCCQEMCPVHAISVKRMINL